MQHNETILEILRNKEKMLKINYSGLKGSLDTALDEYCHFYSELSKFID